MVYALYPEARVSVHVIPGKEGRNSHASRGPRKEVVVNAMFRHGFPCLHRGWATNIVATWGNAAIGGDTENHGEGVMARENFIGGTWRAAKSGATDEVREPGDRRAARRGRRRATRPTSTTRSAPRPRRSTTWSAHDAPRSGSRCCSKVADAIEADMDDAPGARDPQRRQAACRSSSSRWTSPSTTGGSSRPAPASSKAAAAGEYMEDHTSFLRRDPLGVVGVDRAVELPAQHGDVEARSRARGRQHGGAQAVGAHAAHRAAARGDHRRHPPARRAQRRDRRRRDTRARRSCAHPDVAMVSLTGDVATGKLIARAAADSLKRVHLELGGKAPVDRVRRRRRRGARRDPHRDRLLQLGPGLHRAVPRASPARACSTTSSAGSPTRSAQIVDRRPARRGHRDGSGHLGRPARPRAAAWSTARATRAPRSPPAAARATARASSTSRRSS